MFKKFSRDDIHSRTNIKSSVQRGLKSRFVDTYPDVAPVIDTLVPKKSQAMVYKCEDKVQLYEIDGEIVLFQHFDDILPTLKTVHKFPQCFPSVQVDRGAIKFVMGGANIMCPGLTSKGAKLPEENIEADSFVTIYAEGKENALAIGKLVMSTDDIKKINKNIGIEVVHYLADGLWLYSPE